MLALNSEVVCENEQMVGVWGFPLTVCNSQFRSGALDVTLLTVDHWRGVIWNPGIVGQQRVYVCYDCLCLMALFRAMRLLIQDWAGWPSGLG